MVLNNEKNYCSHCYYLIGIASQDTRAEYTILVHTLEANFNNSQLLKVGETIHDSLKVEKTRVYKFVIDELSNFQIHVNMIKGYAYSYLNFIESKNDPLDSMFGSSTLTVKTDDPKFHTGKLYYLILEANTDCEYSILV